MSLIARKQFSIGRATRKERDDRKFVVATEDTDAPKQYFDHLKHRFPRVDVIVLHTPKNSGESSTEHVVGRLHEAFSHASANGEVQEGDEFWVLVDTDHRTRGTHLRNTSSALSRAKQAGFEIAVSNPCFELWLLLHHADPPRGEARPRCKPLEDELDRICKGYNKKRLRAEDFPLEKIPDAIRRARKLESNPDQPAGWWPEGMGTRIYRLLEKIVPSILNRD